MPIEPEAKPEKDQPASAQPRETAPGQYPVVLTVVNDKITVPPRRYWFLRFEVPYVWRSGRVNGRFRAEGGSGNDIKVYILDQDGLENFQNGHAAPTYYNAGKVTVGTIAAQLGPGTYYLVLDNRDSLLSNKVVSIAVSLAQ